MVVATIEDLDILDIKDLENEMTLALQRAKITYPFFLPNSQMVPLTISGKCLFIPYGAYANKSRKEV